MKKKVLIFAMFLLVFTTLTGCVKEQKTASKEQKYNEQEIEESIKIEKEKAGEIKKEENIIQEKEVKEPEEEKKQENILEEIDELGRKTYRNEEYGFEFKYPKDYPFKDITDDLMKPEVLKNSPWYAQPSFLLKYIEINSSKKYIIFEVLNTVNEEKIKTSGGWEFIERVENEKIGNNNYQVFRKRNEQGIKVIMKNGKSFIFSGYLEDVEFNKILETFKFIK